MSETAPRAKLPLWRTVRESYAWGLGHLGEVVNKAWLVLLVLAMVSFVLHWLAHPYVGVAGSVPGNLFTLVVIPLAGVVFGAMVAVPWHRFVLEGERLPVISLSATPRVLSYIGWGVGLTAPILGATMALSGVSEESIENPATATGSVGLAMGSLLVMLVAVYAVTRVSIKLVAVALDDDRATLGSIWRETSWNFWRLLWGTTLTVIPVMVVGIAVVTLLPDQGTARWAYALANAINTCVGILLGMTALTFLSLAYRHFFPKA